MVSRRFLIGSLLPMFATLPAFGDDAAPEKPSSLFSRLFPEPTGKNGYEEIVRAADRLHDAKAPYPNPGTNTLAVKRAYLADPANRAALALLRQGLRKPIAIAIANPDIPVFVSSSSIRSLARLVGFHVYVGLADGDSAGVVGDVLSFLRFADAYKLLDPVSASVGSSLEQSVLTPFTRLRDCWSERDCVRIQTFAQNRPDAPDPAQTALTADRAKVQGIWKQLLAKPEELGDWLDSSSNDDDTEGTTKGETIAERLRVDSGVQARVWGEIPDAINAYYDRAATLFADPTKRLSLETPTIEKSRFHDITLYLRDALVTDISFIVRQAVGNRLINQFLGVHAAIRRYRWENDRLPKTLDELSLSPRLSTDPYTRQPLLYEPEPDGTGYKLASAGGLMPGKLGNPDARDPFTFPREPRKP